MNTNRTKYTPGNWQRSTAYPELIVSQDGNGHFCRVDICSLEYNKNADADAAPNAAAPELLALLKETAASIDEYFGLEDAPCFSSDNGALRARVYAAIAKAEGRQP